MKAFRIALPLALLLSSVVSCKTLPHPTRVNPHKQDHRESSYEDPDLVLLAQNAQSGRRTANLGYSKGWTP